MRIQTFLILSLFMFGTTYAADKEQDKRTAQEKAEAKEAADEDAREAAMDGDAKDPLKYLIVKGTLSLDEGPAGPVLGSITGKDGSYLLKLSNETIRTELYRYNGKEVMLGGKLRNGGKYFLIKEILKGTPPPVRMADPRGL